VDYLHIRADGRCQLNIHAEITTEDGKKIALAADGVAIPEEGSPVFQLKENVTLTSNHPEYAWVNPIPIWARGRSTYRREKSASRHTPPDGARHTARTSRIARPARQSFRGRSRVA